jgi:hypothetical protein
MVAKRFVYGRFEWPHKRRPPATLAIDPDRIAVEIIREYGPNELIGKVYTQVFGPQWVPLDPARMSEFDWIEWYQRLPPTTREAGKLYYFDMEGSGRWAVLHFRNESDEFGVYVAVALRYTGAA